MPSLQVNLEDRSYPILIGAQLLGGALPALQAIAKDRQVAMVTNARVRALYGRALRASLGLDEQTPNTQTFLEIVLPEGESEKNWQSLQLIFDALLKAHFDRNCLLIALGGGVIGDITGFAAAVYQRGVDFVQVPTTLLAQVDSSVGGKTAINHPLGKNMIGAFHQPKLVIADVATLTSLPPRELSAGLAEMLKHGAITDADYFESLLKNMLALRAADAATLTQAVLRSCEIKASVVSQDEKEAGLRATLNFGHTFGHAIEAGLGYGEWLHGEAVGAGMVMAADLSHRLGLIHAHDVERIRSSCISAGLPVKGPAWRPERYIELMAGDKKSEKGIPKFVLLSPFGKAIVRKVPELALRETLQACVT